MKTFKKLGIGLSLLFLLLLFAFFLVPVKKAAAANSFTASDIKTATYTFQDGANISANFSFSSSPIIFTDRNISDGTRNYTPADNGFLCDPGTIKDQGGVKGNIRYGINIASGADLTKSTVGAQIKLDYLVGSNCNPNNAVLANITIANPNQLAATDFQWDSNTIKSLNGSSNVEVLDLKINTNGLIYTSFGDTCGSGDVILLDAPNGNSGKLYTLSPIIFVPRGPSPTQNLSNYPAIAPYFDATKCHVDSGPVAITIAGKAGTAAPGGAGTSTPVGDSCELDSGGFSLAWFMCPLLAAANDLVNGSNGNGGLLGWFEGQLSFNVNRDIGAVGGGNNQVQTTWSLIKNIASAALVIIMLVMIFSQAISAGPFDAYTVRKILPRLVAAVILMQLSWYIVAWMVDIVDDIGNSLFDLLYAPFGGSSQLDLGSLLARANIGTGQAIIIDFVALVGGVVLGLAALPAMLFLAFSAIVALFTALIVLIFRKIIIIFCLIFAPLAILAWILPGTQRYWKLWYDNFLKVLFMFPLIVGLIAAGHIFAFIVGTQGNGTFLNLIFIMIGVFGPLFILPKTFKWGGQAMSLAGGAISNVGSRIQKRGEEPIKGFAQRQQGKWAKGYNPEAGLRSRTLRRIGSGHILPTKRSQRLAIAAGDKWQSERDEEALALINRKGEKAREGYDAIVRNEHGEMLDKNGNVTADEAQADRKHLQGVAAMKQMWVDLAESGRDDHEKKMAIKKLISTSSWPEVQGSFTASGKRVTDTDAWRNAVTTSEEDYPKVLRSRVDAAPHIIDAANRAAEEAGFAQGDDSIEARNFRSAYRVNYAIEKQMSNEDFATQSDGFWGEVKRTANLRDANGNLTKEAVNIRANLKSRLQAIRDIGGTAPQQLLGHLANGGSLEKDVNAAIGDGTTIRNFIPGSTPAAPEPSAATPSGRTYESGNVEGGSRTTGVARENIQRMSNEDAAGWVQSQGGVDRVSNQDLVALYNNQRGGVQAVAREELQRRGLFNPSGPNLPPDIAGPASSPPPASPLPGDSVPPEGGLEIHHDDTDADDFKPGGRYPPPNIPPEGP